MIEPIMYFGIGFLVAALLCLLFVPLVHNRAVRLTMRRVEAATPLSISEIRADKDQLRAEFAMSTRRLEMGVEQMKAKTTSQLAELGKKATAINHLKKELGEKTATMLALEARDRTLRDQLRSTEEEFNLKNDALHSAERALGDKEAELAKLIGELGEQSIAADGQRVELAALRTQVEAMKVTVAEHEGTVKATEDRLAREREDSAAATTELEETRSKLESFGARTAELERQLSLQGSEAELVGRRVLELEVRLGEQGRVLAERDYQIERQRSDLEAARVTEGDLRNELATLSGRNNAVVDNFRSDIAKLEAQLAETLGERTKLEREVSTLKRDAETTWAAERVENALLRERINDVAAEVARLTATLEGPGSPIETMLAVEAPALAQAAGNGASGIDGDVEEKSAAPDRPRDSKSTLADRIRALQSTASRVASSN